MLSKILKIATPIILISIILLIGYKSYKQVTNNAKKLYSNLNSSDIWGYLRNISIVDSINHQIQEISSFYNQNSLIFKSHTLFISIHKVGANNSGLLFSSNFERKAIANNTQINTLLGNLVKEGQYNNQPIFELHHERNILFVSFKGDIVFFSENKMLVEDAIRASGAEDKLLLNPSFNSVYKTISKSAEVNLFFNYNTPIYLQINQL
jgi:hypothetical protein